MKKTIILLFILLSSCAYLGKKQSSQYSSSQTITSQVKHKLAQSLGENAATEIQVTTYKNIVALSGKVKNPKTMEEAVTLAKAIPGVAKVENSLMFR